MKVKLSDRVRPDCEVAKWIHLEIKELETTISQLQAKVDRLEKIKIAAERWNLHRTTNTEFEFVDALQDKAPSGGGEK